MLDAAADSTDNHNDCQSLTTDYTAGDPVAAGSGTAPSDQTDTDSGQSTETQPDQVVPSSTEETTVAESGNASGDSADDVRVLLVSSSLAADQLAAAAQSNVITVTFDGSSDTPETILSTIQTALAGRHAESIAVATHSLGDGQFELTGEYSVSQSSLDASTELQNFWHGVGDLLAADGRVDLLACDLASSEAGGLLISQIESLTGHDVAASDDETGNSADGGDWILETGNVDVAVTYFDSTALSS